MQPNPIWIPSDERVASSQLNAFMRKVGDSREYSELHRWSVEQPEAFWDAVAHFCGLQLSVAPSRIVEHYDRMPGARWFVDAKLNYAENLLAGDESRLALIFNNERGERRELTLGELRAQVAGIAAALRSFGVVKGDRVAGILPNAPEAVIAALATASLGAVWSSCSPDFGAESLRDRLQQVGPKVLFGIDAYTYGGKVFDCQTTLRELVDTIGSIEQVVMTRYLGDIGQSHQFASAHDFAALTKADSELDFTQVPFDHPLFIMFSSGTTGKPKCIVHSVGGTLLQHLKEHRLHTNIGTGDRVFYFTTTGWMMWNWLLSSLASGATLVLYDGAPLYPNPDALWRLADTEAVSVFGTSARYLSAIEQKGCRPGESFRLAALNSILSTGSPLAPASFDYAYSHIKQDMQLASISGGTDIISCFVLGNPMLPVYRGEIQCLGLGMDVRIFGDDGRELESGKGELVCASPFPSMPIGFWNDASGEKYLSAYFERFPSVWHHGDFAELTAHGGVIMHGRSDATLNPGGIRIGTSEIYRILEQLSEVADAVAIGQEFAGDTRIVLFVVPRNATSLDSAAEERIRGALRKGASPHHVPARIIAVSDIPRTLNGKISERAVSDAVHGRAIGNASALVNPEVISEFSNRPELSS